MSSDHFNNHFLKKKKKNTHTQPESGIFDLVFCPFLRDEKITGAK